MVDSEELAKASVDSVEEGRHHQIFREVGVGIPAVVSVLPKPEGVALTTRVE